MKYIYFSLAFTLLCIYITYDSIHRAKKQVEKAKRIYEVSDSLHQELISAYIVLADSLRDRNVRLRHDKFLLQKEVYELQRENLKCLKRREAE